MTDASHASGDLAELARMNTALGPIWTDRSEDLNVNLLVIDESTGVAEHVNAEVDVLVVGIAGAGVAEVDGMLQTLRPGVALIIPKGARRAIRSAGGRFAYLAGHRRRAGLWPRGVPRPGEPRSAP